MRRGQLFSMDAMLSLVLVIMILGTVSATSENLRTEITSLIGWYDRANIADNMLDVLVKTPGEPENWEENPENVDVVGLGNGNGFVIDNNKLQTLIQLLEENNTNCVGVLYNMSSHKNFQIIFSITNASLYSDFNTSYYTEHLFSGDVYNGDCSITGGRDITFENPTIVNCTSGFSRKGNGDLTAYSSLCLVSGFDYTGSGDVNIGLYLAINGTFDESGSGDVTIGGDLYVFDSWDRTGSGSISINGTVYVQGFIDFSGSDTATIGGNVYIFDASSPALRVTGNNDVTIGGWVYIQYAGNWYALSGTISSMNLDVTWYQWEGTEWVPVDSFTSGSLSKHLLKRTGRGEIQIRGGFSLSSPPTEFPVPPCFASEVVSKVLISNMNITVSFKYPSLLGIGVQNYWKSFAVIDGVLVTDPTVIAKSKSKASWIQHSQRLIPISKLVYSKEYTIPKTNQPKELYSGLLSYQPNDVLKITVTPSTGNITLISAFSTGSYSGYSVVVIANTTFGVLSGVNMTKVYQTYIESGIPEGCQITHSGNEFYVPLSCLVPPVPVGDKETFSIWVYSVKGFPSISILDLGTLDVYMKPITMQAAIELWVWDGS